MRPRWELRLEVEEVDEQVDEAVKAVAVALVVAAAVVAEMVMVELGVVKEEVAMGMEEVVAVAVEVAVG